MSTYEIVGSNFSLDSQGQGETPPVAAGIGRAALRS
jgi:hypothetical protein